MNKPYSQWQPAELAALFSAYGVAPERDWALGDERYGAAFSSIWPTMDPNAGPVRYACVTGVLALYEGYTYRCPVISVSTSLIEYGYPCDWIDGIMSGFDGIPPRVRVQENIVKQEHYRLGYDLGRAVAQILFASHETKGVHRVETVRELASV